jgi:hypothetical protein
VTLIVSFGVANPRYESALIVQEIARSCQPQNPDKQSSSRQPTTQEGSIIFMTTGSNLQLSPGHRLDFNSFEV